MAQRTVHSDLVAAPPDDGGDLGIFSRPDGDAQVVDGLRPGASEERHPPLSSDPTHTGHVAASSRRSPVGALSGTLVLLAVTAILLALAMLVARA